MEVISWRSIRRRKETGVASGCGSVAAGDYRRATPNGHDERHGWIRMLATDIDSI